MNRYALALLIVLILAGLSACGSAEDDPAQRVEKPGHEAQVAPARLTFMFRLQIIAATRGTGCDGVAHSINPLRSAIATA